MIAQSQCHFTAHWAKTNCSGGGGMVSGEEEHWKLLSEAWGEVRTGGFDCGNKSHIHLSSANLTFISKF